MSEGGRALYIGRAFLWYRGKTFHIARDTSLPDTLSDRVALATQLPLCIPTRE